MNLLLWSIKNDSDSSYVYQAIAPAKDFKNIVNKSIMSDGQASIQATETLYEKAEPFYMANINDYLKDSINTSILSSLIRYYPLKSAIVFPITATQQQTFLIFSSYFESKLKQQHMELLVQLMPFIEYKLTSIHQP